MNDKGHYAAETLSFDLDFTLHVHKGAYGLWVTELKEILIFNIQNPTLRISADKLDQVLANFKWLQSVFHWVCQWQPVCNQ